MSSAKKEARRKWTKSSSGVSKKEDKEKAGPETGLVRWLRSHKPHPKASLSEVENKSNAVGSAEQPKKRHRKHIKKTVKDDATRIKMRVRYHLNIITREQSLIDAYSADGWKGQSFEKIRPEQELKRAETQILQSKSKIRQELQELHALSLQGSIEESAFDSDGQIYYDDIFCAICKSKEALPDNDIILCDGACNRAFHQFCLDPPLRTEDIPSGDTGWFCPVCDCKFECYDAINDNFGSDLKMEDNWEKVFAEAEDVETGDNNLLGALPDWPSEDSEDDDYHPEMKKPSLEPGGSGRESASDDGSGSDFGSGSDSDSDSSDSGSEVEFFDEFAGMSRGKKSALSENDEAEEVEEDPAEDEEEAVLVSGKRQRPDVDYKQLYDEVYGANASDFDSSEDEEWGKKKPSKDAKEAANGKQGSASEAKQKQSPGSEGGNVPEGRKRLAKDVVAKLKEFFEECELPSKAQKQELSSQLGAPFDSVNTWFRNARSSATKKRKYGSGTKSSGLSQESNGQQTSIEESTAAETGLSEAPGDDVKP